MTKSTKKTPTKRVKGTRQRDGKKLIIIRATPEARKKARKKSRATNPAEAKKIRAAMRPKTKRAKIRASKARPG